ncbi:hypothetical protein EI94DRAFT_593075 [Lactarius quietus]|nr:hypothetical protein EI94DRAFT_593075 [Lactarius quietus]
MPRRTDVAYGLPSTIKSLNDRRLEIYRGSTILARRFAILEVHLLSFAKNDANFGNNVGNSAKRTLVILTYLALFFCLGAVVSGQILAYWSVELPVRPPQERGLVQEGLPDSGTLDVMQNHGVKRTWIRIWVIWHWAFSLIAGTVSFITQVLLYVWLEEPNSVRIVVSIITVFVVLPLVTIFFRHR